MANNNVAELFVYKAEEPSGRAVVVLSGRRLSQPGYRLRGARHGALAGRPRYDGRRAEIPYAQRSLRSAAQRRRAGVAHHARTRRRVGGYDASRVGIVGSSAGGHLAASTGTISDEKPAFMILFYPVITAEEGKLHKNSFKYLLGKDYSPEEARNYSLEKRVSALTPPTLLLLSDDDRIVPPVNSLRSSTRHSNATA